MQKNEGKKILGDAHSGRLPYHSFLNFVPFAYFVVLKFRGGLAKRGNSVYG